MTGPDTAPESGGPLRALGLFVAAVLLSLACNSPGARHLLGSYEGVLFAAIWLYLPIWAVRREGGDLQDLGLTWRQDRRVWPLLGLCVAILVPYAFALKYWVVHVEGGAFRPFLPANLPSLALDHLVLVALPEELFYRGYLQPRLDAPGRGPTVLGWRLGPGVLAASALFALAHLVILRQPASLSVFFPSLLFGLLRQESGSVLLPVAYHALCNLYKIALVG